MAGFPQMNKESPPCKGELQPSAHRHLHLGQGNWAAVGWLTTHFTSRKQCASSKTPRKPATPPLPEPRKGKLPLRAVLPHKETTKLPPQLETEEKNQPRDNLQLKSTVLLQIWPDNSDKPQPEGKPDPGVLDYQDN